MSYSWTGGHRVEKGELACRPHSAPSWTSISARASVSCPASPSSGNLAHLSPRPPRVHSPTGHGPFFPGHPRPLRPAVLIGPVRGGCSGAPCVTSVQDLLTRRREQGGTPFLGGPCHCPAHWGGHRGRGREGVGASAGFLKQGGGTPKLATLSGPALASGPGSCTAALVTCLGPDLSPTGGSQASSLTHYVSPTWNTVSGTQQVLGDGRRTQSGCFTHSSGVTAPRSSASHAISPPLLGQRNPRGHWALLVWLMPGTCSAAARSPRWGMTRSGDKAEVKSEPLVTLGRDLGVLPTSQQRAAAALPQEKGHHRVFLLL